jgi:hypothetical protein
MESIGPWVQDCLRMMDSDGAYCHYKVYGSLSDQPSIWMEVLDTVKSRWCELRNADMERKYGQQASGNHKR